jgi:hypothetical protein
MTLAKCLICGDLMPTQLTLTGEELQRVDVCKGCRQVHLNGHILILGDDKFGLMDEDLYLQHFGPFNKTRISDIPLSAVENLANKQAIEDQDRKKEFNELQDLYEELEIVEGEAAEIRSKIEDTKKEVEGYDKYYLDELITTNDRKDKQAVLIA